MSEKGDNKMMREADYYDSILDKDDTWVVVFWLFIFIIIVSSSKTCGTDNKASSYKKYD